LTARGRSTDHRGILGSTTLRAVIAGLPPLLVYVATASGFAHWFDSGEFVAAAADFGISHPPGQPLAAIVLGAANLVPLGPLAFRTTLVCALCNAAAVVFLAFAFERTFSAGDAIKGSLRFPVALAAAWWMAGTFAWWFQAVRTEVYALQAALLAFALERLVRVSFEGRDGDVRPLFHAALAFGLALSNHHFIALLAVFPALWLLVGVQRTFGWRPFAWGAAFVGAGLATYVFLPLRALQQPFLDLGDPSTPSRFWWVVSAQAFQKSVDTSAVSPFGDRLMDVLLVGGEDLHIVVVVVALLGAYFMLRVTTTRKYALFWLTLWLVYAVGRAFLGFVVGNPDARAYFMLSYASVTVFAAFAIGVVLSAVSEAVPTKPRLAPALATLMALTSTLHFARSADAASLAAFVDTDVLDDGLRRRLPERAVVLVHNPQTIFRMWGGEAEEMNRPDVTMVPLPLLSYPKMVERLVAHDPELKAVLRSYVLDGTLSASELQTLSTERPVFVEMDVRIERELMDLLVPELLYHRVLSADLTDNDEASAAQRHALEWGLVYGRLGRPLDEYTVAQLIWRHYADSLYFAALGDIQAAKRTMSWGLLLNPLAAELRALSNALDDAPPGVPIDVTPFTIR
jgi:hypothetical protein